MPTIAKNLYDSYRQSPDQVVLTMLKTGEEDSSITYKRLFTGASAFARALKQGDILQDEVVIIILQHGIELVNAFFGTILHGAIPSIMPYLTEKLLPDRYRSDLISLFNITKPAAVITYRDFEEEVKNAVAESDSVRHIIVAEDIDLPSEQIDISSLGGLKRDDKNIAFLQHSSGTTGLKKGVALSHHAVFNQLNSYQKAINITSGDVVVSWLPLYHDMGLIAGFLIPVLLRLHLILLSPFDWVRAPYRLLQAVAKYQGTLSWMPNFAYNFCAKKIRPRHLENIDLSSWRAVINCSEPTRWDSHQEFYERFQPYGIKRETLMTCYAMAENVFAVTQSTMGREVTFDEIDRNEMQTIWEAVPAKEYSPSIKMLSSGRPIENVEIKILDQNRNECPERKIGEIVLRSNCMLTGYYNRQDATDEAFIDGWYLTGDYGYLCEGELYVTGRKKELLIVGGKNIYPQDIEELAMEVSGVHPGRVVAFGIFNQQTGTEEVVIVAEVETDDEEERDNIREAVMSNVTRGSAIALRNVYLVASSWLIKTSSGKTARLANRDKYLEECPEG